MSKYSLQYKYQFISDNANNNGAIVKITKHLPNGMCRVRIVVKSTNDLASPEGSSLTVKTTKLARYYC